MRILILANYANGLYLFRKELLEAFMEKGCEVVASVPQDENCHKLTELGVRVVAAPLDRHGMNPIKDFGLFCYYLGLIKKEKPDAILTYTIKPNIYGGIASKLKKVPYICNVTGLGTAIEENGTLSKILVGLYGFATNKAQRVFFQNERNKDFMQKKGVAVKNAGLLPGSGVNLEAHPFEEYPSEDDGIRFLAVLRVMKDKGVAEYFDMIREIKKNHDNAHFELVGEYEEDERAVFEPRIQELEKEGLLKYYGHINNVSQVMAGSHVIVHPSYHEGLSNVLLEAAACGRPVLTTNINGCKEVVDKDKSGLLFEPKSVSSLTEAVERILKLRFEDRKQMGQKGRALVEEKFDRKLVIDAYFRELSL